MTSMYSVFHVQSVTGACALFADADAKLIYTRGWVRGSTTAGFDKHSAVFLSMLPAFVNMLGSLLGVYCIERTGRRRLLLGSLAGVSLSLLLLGYTFNLAQSKDLYVTVGDTTPNGEVCDVREVRTCTPPTLAMGFES